jgi:PKHD-type hydroxylase
MPSYTKYIRPLVQHAIVENYFTDEEVDKIIDFEELQEFSDGKMGSGVSTDSTNTGRIDKKYRDSEISWLRWSPESRWIFDKFSGLLGQINHAHFMYDIDGFDAFQYTKYKKNQHYNWHFDAFTEYQAFERKISAVVMLTDPEKYTGGELEVVIDGNIEKPMSIRPPKGSVIFFASWMPHRVAPVKSGVRKSLVAWIMGKRVC